jgi:hypothetical protein
MNSVNAVPPVEPHAGWDDDDLEIGIIFGVQRQGNMMPDDFFNMLYADNRGRFFLVRTRRIVDPLDLPWNAFHQIDKQTAIEWGLEMWSRWAHGEFDYERTMALDGERVPFNSTPECVGTLAPLLEIANQMLRARKS